MSDVHEIGFLMSKVLRIPPSMDDGPWIWLFSQTKQFQLLNSTLLPDQVNDFSLCQLITTYMWFIATYDFWLNKQL